MRTSSSPSLPTLYPLLLRVSPRQVGTEALNSGNMLDLRLRVRHFPSHKGSVQSNCGKKAYPSWLHQVSLFTRTERRMLLLQLSWCFLSASRLSGHPCTLVAPPAKSLALFPLVTSTLLFSPRNESKILKGGPCKPSLTVVSQDLTREPQPS